MNKLSIVVLLRGRVSNIKAIMIHNKLHNVHMCYLCFCRNSTIQRDISISIIVSVTFLWSVCWSVIRLVRSVGRSVIISLKTEESLPSILLSVMLLQ